MPGTTALRYCLQPGCSVKVESGRCPLHEAPKRQHERRHYTGTRGVNYGRRWQRARTEFLAKHPFCVDCQAEGNLFGLAEELDHERPHKGSYDLFWDPANWTPRCKRHHSEKTSREVRFGGAG